MYVEDWDSFLQMAEALFRQAPLRTRYVLKYRHCDGKLVLKVTDDVAAPILYIAQCLKYYTDQQSDVRRVEQLNGLFFRLMAAGPDAPAEDVEMAPAASDAQQPQAQQAHNHQQQRPAQQRQRHQQQGGKGGGGGKKRRG